MEASKLQSLNAYAKNLELQSQWNTQVEAIEHGAAASLEEQAEKRKERKLDHTLQLIETKLASGKAPTEEEMAYLKEKDPERFAQAEQICQERDSYEEALKDCASEEDVKLLKMSRLTDSIAIVESIKNNPLIAPEQKLQYIVVEHQKAAAINQMTQKFIKQGQYRSLSPQEQAEAAEKRKAMEEQLKARTEGAFQPADMDTELQGKKEEALSEELVRKVQQAKVKAQYLLYADVYSEDAEEVVLSAKQQAGLTSVDTKA